MKYESKFEYEKVWHASSEADLKKMIEEAMPESPVDEVLSYIIEALGEKKEVKFLDFAVRLKKQG